MEVKEKIWQPRYFRAEEAMEMVKQLDALPARRPLYVLAFARRERFKEHIAVGYISDYALTIYEKDARLIIPLSALDYIRILGEVMG